MDKSPKVFISYSHDSEEHKKWVLKLATDLRQHMGVDVSLDQWELRIGSDLSLFMEQGLSDASLVLCVCSEEYVRKADAGVCGTGYERMILVQSMLKDTNTDFIIPIVRNNQSRKKTPRYMGAKVYIDFSDDSLYLDKLSELVARIYNKDIMRKPQIGISPFDRGFADRIKVKTLSEKTQYHSLGMRGTVSFNYTNNSGMFTIGSGEFEFNTKWSECGNNSIYACRDEVSSIGYILGRTAYPEFCEIQTFDFSSRVRTVYVGEVIIWMNKFDRFAATKIIDISRAGQNIAGKLSFEYLIYA